MKIEYKNIRRGKSKYKYAVCLAYYFGKPTDISKNKKQPEKKKYVMLDTLECLINDKALKDSLFIILDDDSPIKIPSEEIFKITKRRPTIYFSMEENVGVAKKENIFNAISVNFSDYMIRIDNDIILKDSLEPALNAFKKIKNIGGVTINCGVVAFYTFQENPDKDYADSKALGNVFISPSEVFEKVSMNDPELGYFHDIDIIYKIIYEGYRCIVSRYPKADHKRSGANKTKNIRKKEAQLFTRKNPLVNIYWNKKGIPICRYTNRNKNLLQDGYKKIGPCKEAEQIIKEINKIIKRKKI